MRKFNIAGPCDPRRHHMLPAAPRLPGTRELIDDLAYFVVHAPRQTGKTTTLRAWAKALTDEGQYAALHFSCESAEPVGDEFATPERRVLDVIRLAAGWDLPAELRPPSPWPDAGDGGRLQAGLAAWAHACPRPLVLFFDEIDAVRGESLKSLLRQIRGGHAARPAGFPASVVLCGLRDVRDYKIASGGDPTRLGTASPFNIKERSLRLDDFTQTEVAALYTQHTEATGQPFADDALERAWDLAQGQPWLTNALAREAIDQFAPPVPQPITADHVDQAKESLILQRATHLDSLTARLQEPRVRRIIEPLIAGHSVGGDTYDDDVLFVRDLGLVARDSPVRIANPIYREVIVRALGAAAEDNVDLDPRSYLTDDGQLDMDRLLREFVAFWREHGAVLVGRMPYHEIAPQLVLMAYLQRVVNGGGYVDREYGVGRGRIDLLVRWPYAATVQREALELKVWRHGRPDPLPEGLAQLDGYLAGLGLEQGYLVIFDRRVEGAGIDPDPSFATARSPSGRDVVVVRA